MGGCPRYGRPGSRAAIYNDDIRLADDDAVVEAADEDLWRWQMQILMEQADAEEPGFRIPPRAQQRSSRSGVSGIADRPASSRGQERVYGPGDRTEATSRRQTDVPARQSPQVSRATQTPRRSLRQSIRERGRVFLDRFR